MLLAPTARSRPHVIAEIHLYSGSNEVDSESSIPAGDGDVVFDIALTSTATDGDTTELEVRVESCRY